MQIGHTTQVVFDGDEVFTFKSLIQKVEKSQKKMGVKKGEILLSSTEMKLVSKILNPELTEGVE